MVAAAVYCAAEQGRAYELHDALASHPTLPDAATIAALAEQSGLEREAVAACLARPATTAAVARDSAAAEDLGLVDPPALLVDGIVFGGMQSLDRLRAVVRDAAARGR
jgi:predicted DsbA family dithiol-disulfide isomerase